jgi:hypothetical protein
MNWKTFFKLRSTNGQEIHEEVFNIFSHQGNANQDYIEIPSHSSHNGYHQENKKPQIQLMMQEEKGILIHCWWECKLLQPLRKSVWSLLKNLKIELHYDPALQLLYTHPKESKSAYLRATCTLITKLWNQFRCQSMDEQIKKMLHI